jgi:FlaA1/EpsC-like NDP-sugar epimerase
LKTDLWSFSQVRHSVLDLATTFAPVTVLVFWWSGLYRGSWRVSGLDDLVRACKAVAIVTIVGGTLVTLLSDAEYSLSIFGIYGIVSLVLTASLRGSYVVLENTRLRSSHQGIPVLIYGADVRGVAAVRELFQNAAAGLRPIGFIDDDPRQRGKLVSGLPVFGTERELGGIIRMHKAQGLLVAAETIPLERLERAERTCKKAGARMFRLNVRVEQFGEDIALERRAHRVQPARPAEAEYSASRGVLATMHVLGSDPCPSCGSREVYRSKARTFYEKLRKAHTPKRVFRCHHCSWRGWLLPLDCAALAEATWSPSLTAIDTFIDADQLRDAS